MAVIIKQESARDENRALLRAASQNVVALVPRGGIELSSIGLKLGHFSNENFPVYPLVYPALRILWQRVRSHSLTFDAPISMANRPKPCSVSSILALRRHRFESCRVRHSKTVRSGHMGYGFCHPLLRKGKLGTPKPGFFALEAATSVRRSTLFYPMMRISSRWLQSIRQCRIHMYHAWGHRNRSLSERCGGRRHERGCARNCDYGLSENPMCGDLMPGTGGARKVRFAAPGRGKRAGYRTIHYYGGEDVPVFLLAVVKKGERADLSKAEKNELRKELAGLADDYRKAIRAKALELRRSEQ